MNLPPDFIDLLAAFDAAKVEYLIVGGYAVAYWSEPRFTKDLDLWIGQDASNLARARMALLSFGAPDELVRELATASPDDVLWMGRPPTRIDLLKGVPGGEFADAYAKRVEVRWADVPVQMVALDDLIALKRASGRAVDSLDIEKLEAVLASGTPANQAP